MIEGLKSETFFVTSGMPQGSHLGPLLFLLFMLLIPFFFARCLMNADYIKIVHPINNIHVASALQLDLNALSSWCQTNRFYLNLSKCKTMSFYCCRAPIIFEYQIDDLCLERVVQFKDLGILFNQKLRLINHIII